MWFELGISVILFFAAFGYVICAAAGKADEEIKREINKYIVESDDDNITISTREHTYY